MADPVTAPAKGQSRIRTVLGQGIGLAASADARSDGSFYFGFSTTDRVRTKADDSLIVTLKTTKDLLGRGPYSGASLLVDSCPVPLPRSCHWHRAATAIRIETAP